MSVDTSRTTALSALVIDQQRCCSAQYLASIAFQIARNPATQCQHRSFKLDHRSTTPNRYILATWTASSTRPTAIKSP